MFQINVGQKNKENQWSIVDLQEFLYTALLYQAMTNRNINVSSSLKQYFLAKKEQWDGLFAQLVVVSA